MFHSASDLDYLGRPGRRKRDMGFGAWDVGSLRRAGSLKTLAREMAKYNRSSGRKRGQMG